MTTSRRGTRAAAALAAVLVVAAATTAEAARKELRLQLVVPSDLELTGTERIYVGPVILEPRSAEPTTTADLTAVREFESWLRSQLRRQTRLQVADPIDGLAPPSRVASELVEATDFWRQIGQQSGAQYVVAASIDVEVLDREGYRTEEYVSPADGKTYFRQVLVEETGFNYDVLMLVFSGETGELVLRRNVTDFKERDERKLNEFNDMFEDLYQFQTRILGMFTPRVIEAKRTLYTD